MSPPARARPADVARFLGKTLWHCLRGAIVCLLFGRVRKAWSLRMHAVVAMQRATYELLSALGAQRFHQTLEAVSPLFTDGTRRETVELGERRGDWLVPEHDGGTVILYFHGGGYIFGSLRTHGRMIGALARAAGARTLVLDYRLAPEHPAPAAIDDALAAYRHLCATGIPSERIVLAGDSAGGNLVLATLVALRDAGDPMPAAGVAISPWVDLACSGESFDTNAAYDFVSRAACKVAADSYLGGADPRSPELSPLFAELHGLPPLLVQAGALEVLVDQIRAFARRAEAAGVDVQLSVHDEMVHVWHILHGIIPEARAGIEEIASFVRRKVAGS
ncbi:alpha/beta hydrolase [Paraliomyxa miuraensis]|uniref:alpha/beta hydrolase n=1 Tax=Paraliomyxa miuraensis TaxID=376150 RepID=UPI002250E279|nr:alpha/beta hydrolase [Paraliomyxa miuraensis]MCX4240488.1 alpha/beta hydrolase [Paraliomyxa miuraensis]